MIKKDPEGDVDAAKAAWKADEAKGFSVPASPGDSLWDPVVRPPASEEVAVEAAAPPAEPAIVRPIDRAADRPANVEATAAAAPPAATAPADHEAPESLAQLVPSVLALLEDGSVNAALAVEEDWRDRGGDDAAGPLAPRWALVRELLGVAGELPVPVVTALAHGIGAGDASMARPALEAFRATDAKAANAAHTLLATRAPALHAATSGALFSTSPSPPPRPAYYANYTPPPSISRSSGMSGWRVISIFAVVISGILRIAANSHSTYDYHPIDIPKFDPKLYDLPPMPSTYDPGQDSYTPPPAVPPSPLPMQAGADRAALLDELIGETQNLTTYGLVAYESEAKVDAFLGDALDDACPRMRVSFVKVEKLKAIDDADKAAAAKEQIAAIRQRLDVVCPKKKPARPSPPATGSSK